MNSESFRLAVEHLFYGILLFQFFYNLILYKHYQEKATLYYNVYILVIAAYFLNIRFEYILLIKPNVTSLQDWQMLSIGFFEPLIYIAYFNFAKSFLNSKRDFSLLNNLINLMIIVSSLEIVIPYILFHLNQAQLAINVNLICKPINIFIAAYIFWWFYKNAKVNLLTRFIFSAGIVTLCGNVFYHIGKSNLSFLFNPYIETYDLLRVSFLIDLLIFSSGLAYKYHYLNLNRIDKAKKEIITLKAINRENQILEQKLDRELKEKVIQVEQSNKLLLKKKIERELLDLQRELLSAQMNPHLLFNSLSSIKVSIMEDQIEKSDKYLKCYLQMLCNMIVQSKQPYISIEVELQCISNYIELEKVRFNNDLQVVYKIDPSIEPNKDMIAPMLIQPFIENALWHGLKPKKSGEKKLQIYFEKVRGMLVVEIIDNGIGRRNNLKSLKKHKSRSMTIIEKRMNLLEKLKKMTANYIITDLKDPEGEPLGTKIRLNIPLITHTSI